MNMSETVPFRWRDSRRKLGLSLRPSRARPPVRQAIKRRDHETIDVQDGGRRGRYRGARRGAGRLRAGRPGTGGGTVRGRKRCPRGRGSRRDPRARFLRRRGGGILEGHLPQRVPNLYGQRVQQPPGQAGLPDRVPGVGDHVRRLRLRQGLRRGGGASLQPAVRGRDAPREREHAGQLHHLQDAPVHRHGELRGRFGLPEALRRGAHADDRAHQLLQLP